MWVAREFRGTEQLKWCFHIPNDNDWGKEQRPQTKQRTGRRGKMRTNVSFLLLPCDVFDQWVFPQETRKIEGLSLQSFPFFPSLSGLLTDEDKIIGLFLAFLLEMLGRMLQLMLNLLLPIVLLSQLPSPSHCQMCSLECTSRLEVLLLLGSDCWSVQWWVRAQQLVPRPFAEWFC